MKNYAPLGIGAFKHDWQGETFIFSFEHHLDPAQIGPNYTKEFPENTKENYESE